MARSRRRVTAELIRAKREGKGRKKEWQPRGELIPPNKVHITKTDYKRRKGSNNWKRYLELVEEDEKYEEYDK